MTTPETPTPRTDAEKPECIKSDCGSFVSRRYVVSADFARTLERENAQLKRELEEAKRQAQVSDTERRAFIADLESVQQGLINDLGKWKAMIREAMFCIDGWLNGSDGNNTARSRDLIKRFNSMNK